MAGEIGQAFIRIRPNTTGFKSETEAGVKGAFSGIGKIVGVSFAIGGIAEATAAVSKAAASQEAELTVVRSAVKQTNSAWVVHGQTVKAILEEQARATGFNVSELAQSFNRIQLGTRNTTVSLKLLAAAENLARAQHRPTSVAALALARAYEGSAQSLRRFGIVIPNVTKAEDELKRKHEEAIIAGAKFTAAQTALFKTQLEAAKATDKQATSQQVLTEVQARAGGIAAAFAKTTAGEFARLHETINQFEVFLGDHVLPTLSDAADGLRKFFDAARNNRGLGEDISSIATAVKSSFDAVVTGARDVASVVIPIVHGVQQVEKEFGGGGIVAAVVGYKALGASISFARDARALYNRVLALGRAVEAQDAAALSTSTAALTANTAAQERNSAATRIGAQVATVAQREQAALTASQTVGALRLTQQPFQGGTIIRSVDSGRALTTTKSLTAAIAEQTVAVKANAFAQDIAAGQLRVTSQVMADGGLAITTANGEIVASSAAVTAALGAEEAATVSFGAVARGVFGALGGATTVAALGLGAVAFGIYKLVTADSALDIANKRVLASLTALDREYQRQSDLRKQLAFLKDQAPLDAEAVANAKLGVQQAALNLSRDKSKAGTIAHQQAVLALVNAIQQVHQAEKQQKDDESQLAKTHDILSVSHRRAARDIGGTIRAYNDVAKAARDSGRAQAIAADRVGSRVGTPTSFPSQAVVAAKAAQEFAKTVAKDAAKEQNKTLRQNETFVAQLARQTNKIPSAKTIKFVLQNTDPRATLQQLIAKLRVESNTVAITARSEGEHVGHSYGDGVAVGISDRTAKMADSMVAGVTKAKQAAKDALGIRSPSEVARKEIGHQISEGIVLGLLDKNGSVSAALENQLNAAIDQGVKSVQAAIVSAKQNLNQIGSSLASDIQTIVQKIGSTVAPSGPAGTQLKGLLGQLNGGGSTPDLVRHAQAVANQVSAQQSIAAARGDQTSRKIADLTDELNKGTIGFKAFQAGIDKIVKQSVGSPNRVQTLLGVAQADALRGEVQGVRQQAKAILDSPKFGGAALVPQIVKPLDTIKQEQQNIAQAAKAQRDQQIAEQKKAIAEAKRHTKLLEKIHAAQLANKSLDPGLKKILKAAGVTPKEFGQALAGAVHNHGR